MRINVPNGYTFGAVGDLIISRPLTQYRQRLPGFGEVLNILRSVDSLYGNLETTLFDAHQFKGSPFSWDGDWTNSASPDVAADLKSMGFSVLSRANNHSLDWGLEGMRETSMHLNAAALSYAGVGEDRGRARAPGYTEGVKARVALVSIASTFRPTSDALPSEGATPGRPGLSALHVVRTVILPPEAFASMAQVACQTLHRQCEAAPREFELFDTHYRVGAALGYDYAMDSEDVAEIDKNIRSARENADIVVVSIHAHECSVNCDDSNAPRGPGNFLKQLAHDAIDSGADVFVVTGNHNLGPIELYRSRVRGIRPIFYGLGNFFWSDVQPLLPHDLYQGNRALLASAWHDPSKATDYDLTAPLNTVTFAHDFTFQSVIAVSRFDGSQVSAVCLYPIDSGYGRRLTESGIPVLVHDKSVASAIVRQITEATADYGLPPLSVKVAGQGIQIFALPASTSDACLPARTLRHEREEHIRH